MQRLLQSIRKDFSLLLRDKTGLLLMFLMPIVLVMVITSLQNNTFKMVNDHQIALVIFNQDKGDLGEELAATLQKAGMFTVIIDSSESAVSAITEMMTKNDALVGLQLTASFSEEVLANVNATAASAFGEMGLHRNQELPIIETINGLNLYYSPVLQETYRMAIEGALQSSLQLIVSKKMINSVFFSIKKAPLSGEVEQQLLQNKIELIPHTVTSDGSGKIPNASQHNVPAWTIFAMFFMVVSLGSSLVREKNNGSFIRLKTMPGAYQFHIMSKQIVYVLAALAQVFVIFSLGVFVFPHIGLPSLEIPHDVFALLVVGVASGLCAVSYALCIGVFAQTEEQANGFGAVSIVILAALGGILVPAFAMPDSFRMFTAISPLFWCLEAFYQLFLNGSDLAEIWPALLPIGLFIALLQIVSFWGMKHKNLI